jgi:hypothetical protein
MTEVLNPSADSNLPSLIATFYSDLQQALQNKQTIVVHSVTSDGTSATLVHAGPSTGILEIGSASQPLAMEDASEIRRFIRERMTPSAAVPTLEKSMKENLNKALSRVSTRHA